MDITTAQMIHVFEQVDGCLSVFDQLSSPLMDIYVYLNGHELDGRGMDMSVKVRGLITDMIRANDSQQAVDVAQSAIGLIRFIN